jgi:hypothetical protein
MLVLLGPWDVTKVKSLAKVWTDAKTAFPFRKAKRITVSPNTESVSSSAPFGGLVVPIFALPTRDSIKSPGTPAFSLGEAPQGATDEYYDLEVINFRRGLYGLEPLDATSESAMDYDVRDISWLSMIHVYGVS